MKTLTQQNEDYLNNLAIKNATAIIAIFETYQDAEYKLKAAVGLIKHAMVRARQIECDDI